MSKPPTKLPLNRNKPVGRSITAADVAGLVRAAAERQVPANAQGEDVRPKPPGRTGKRKPAP